jgi:death on curing protein
MTEPLWVPLAAIITIHDRQIARHGGAAGMRDKTLLEAGCTRPQNAFSYGEPSLEEMAAGYAFGISKAHAFIDGNKRAAIVTTLTFLRLNGRGFRPEPSEGVRMIEDLASSQLTEDEFAAWLREGSFAL